MLQVQKQGVNTQDFAFRLKDPLKKWLVLDERKQLLQYEGLECFRFFYGKIGHRRESFLTPVAPTRPIDVACSKAQSCSVPKTKGIVDASNGSVSSPKAATPRITQNKQPTSSVSVAPSSMAGNIAHSIITFKKYQTFADTPTVPFIAAAVSSGAAADAALPSRPAISKISMAADLQSNTHDKLVNSVPTFGLAAMNKPSEAAASCSFSKEVTSFEASTLNFPLPMFGSITAPPSASLSTFAFKLHPSSTNGSQNTEISDNNGVKGQQRGKPTKEVSTKCGFMAESSGHQQRTSIESKEKHLPFPLGVSELSDTRISLPRFTNKIPAGVKGGRLFERVPFHPAWNTTMSMSIKQ
ncbi:hypothetical protein Gotur_001214 [Gossypium turneri]